eukprot:3103585-Amphidinium_carterae.1
MRLPSARHVSCQIQSEYSVKEAVQVARGAEVRWFTASIVSASVWTVWAKGPTQADWQPSKRWKRAGLLMRFNQ